MNFGNTIAANCVALFIFVYFMTMPLLAAMMPNVEGNCRSDLWVEPRGWLYQIEPWTRIIIATAMVICALLGGVFDA